MNNDKYDAHFTEELELLMNTMFVDEEYVEPDDAFFDKLKLDIMAKIRALPPEELL